MTKHTPQAMRAMAELLANCKFDEAHSEHQWNMQEKAAAMLRDIADEMEATNYPEIPEGWKLVPVEPTNEMCIEAQRRVAYMTVNTPYGKLCRDQYAHAWIAMLDAAPSPKGDV
jgi:hypothetical protein